MYITKLRPNSSQSFTLIELLVVIGVLAVLALAVLISLNPQELIKQARDSKRISDLASINKALSWLLADCPNCFFGTSSIVYVSIPDTSSNCSNLNLPPLPPGYQYRCVTQENLRKIDGNGWIPVNFKQFSAGSSLSSLPVDPINNAQTGEYYTYVTGGSWSLASLLTSKKYQETSRKNGEFDPERYVIGTNLNLWRDAYGIVGYWKFDEGSGTTAYDSSGNNNHGTLYNGPTWTQGKVNGALSFDGVNDYVSFGNKPQFNMAGDKDFTLIVWVNIFNLQSSSQGIFGKLPWNCGGYGLELYPNGTLYTNVKTQTASACGCSLSRAGRTNVPLNNWIFIANPVKRNENQHLFFNGEVVDIKNISSLFGCSIDNSSSLAVGYPPGGGANYFSGLIDEVRIYNRALSESEIKAIYEATKQ